MTSHLDRLTSAKFVDFMTIKTKGSFTAIAAVSAGSVDERISFTATVADSALGHI